MDIPFAKFRKHAILVFCIFFMLFLFIYMGLATSIKHKLDSFSEGYLDWAVKFNSFATYKSNNSTLINKLLGLDIKALNDVNLDYLRGKKTNVRLNINIFDFQKLVTYTFLKKYTIDGKSVVLEAQSNITRLFIYSILYFLMVVLLCFCSFAVFKTIFIKKVNMEVDNLANYINNALTQDNTKHTIIFFKKFDKIYLSLELLLKKVKDRDKLKKKLIKRVRLSNRQKEDIVSAISHEFKNPITSIMGYAEAISDDVLMSQEIRNNFFQKIYRNVKRLSDTIDMLIMYKNFENKNIDLSLSKFDILKLAKISIEMASERLNKRNIIISGQSRDVVADFNMIKIVFDNILDNAIKYSNADIQVSILEDRVCIKDYGRGIIKKDIKNIVKKFYRSEKKFSHSSMGLGLFLVKSILDLHNSKLIINSEINEGSTFCFLI